uniref:L1 transposable element RRM domain-containing protein n=1 Tax=Erpetoichthys calabaricus TaxID=27687 RepID=A0A8C4RI41_ERPCA
MEDGCRRNNMRINGLPENHESLNPVKFIAELFSKIIGEDFKSDPESSLLHMWMEYYKNDLKKATIELKNELKKDNKDKETRLFKRFDVNFKGMLEKLVEHIEETKSKLKMLADQINDVTDQLEDVKQGLADRVETAEQLASNADEKATAAYSECKKLGDRLAVLEEGCRRNNIRIEGIPEKRESSSSSPVKFAVELLSKIIGDDFKLDIEIATAYRTNRPSTFKPRSFIVRFERLRCKLDVMALLRHKQEIIFENNLIHIFPDFSPSTAAKRTAYIDIKKLLRKADIKYSLLYPIKLKVEVQDQYYIFLSKEETEKELKKLFPTLF